MRCHTAAFSSGVMNTQLLTSIKVRPQPLQISSYSVEQMPMQGVSDSASPVNKELAPLMGSLEFEVLIAVL
jgi:hypothetical protein